MHPDAGHGAQSRLTYSRMRASKKNLHGLRTLRERQEIFMSKTIPEQNKALVLEAFDTLFNKRDYAAAERYWSDRYIQHSAHIAPGRKGLFNLIRALPNTLR